MQSILAILCRNSMGGVVNIDNGELGYLIGRGGYHFDLPGTVRTERVEAHPCGTVYTDSTDRPR